MRFGARFGVIVVGIAAAVAACEAAATVTTATGKGADTYVANDEKNGPKESLGGAKSAEVRLLDGKPSRVRIAYLRFDLSSVSGDKTGATLTLNMYKPANRARAVTVYGLKDGEDDNWPEATMSYSTAPGLKSATLGSFAIDTEKLTKLGTITFAEQDDSRTSTTTELPLDGFLKADTNGLVTLVLVDDGKDANGEEDYYIDTKEGNPGNAARMTFPNATGGDTTTTAAASQPAATPKAATTKPDEALP
jgi:hypothetical protein